MKDDMPRKTMLLTIIVVAVLIISSALVYMEIRNKEDDDDISRDVMISPGDHYSIHFTGNEAETMELSDPPLSPDARKAIKKMPDWLESDLERKFVELSEMPVEMDSHSVPCFHDLGQDGDMDLAVGGLDSGITFKENMGDQYVHAFGNDQIFEDIPTTRHTSPAMVDLDGDADTDLVMGSEDGTLHYYQNTGSDSKPEWEKNVDVFSGIDVGRNSHPYFADMEGDGDLDLTIGAVNDGTNDANLFFYWNQGTETDPEWVQDDLVYAGLLIYGIEQYPYPAIADLDGDGNLDLTLGGRNGQLRHFTMDVGGVAVWREIFTLYTDIDVGGHASPTFADLNGDDCLDLVVGTLNGTLFFFENTGTPENPRFIALCSGEIYHSGTMGEVVGDSLHEARKVFLGPGTINIDRTLKERVEQDVETYADLILNTSGKYVDELGFIIANTAVPVLRAMTGTIELNDPECTYGPEILVEHVKEHYELKGKLNYADIIEKDDYTTIRYINGAGEKMEVPRDVYYWFIIHPRCRYEVPGYTHNDFWREYLRYDDSYGTSLFDAVKDANTTTDAVYKLTEWVDGFMDFGYDSTDKTPIEIYDLHYGSCGEHSVLANALGRAVFIPTRLANNWGEDHVWNEFYDDSGNWSWHHWDITGPNIDDPESYERDWNKDISTVWTHRGDDFVYGITEPYTPTSHLTLKVVDRAGNAVDGACVVMESEYFVRTNPTYWPVPTISLWNYTDTNGECRFEVGDNYYTIDVMSPIGNYHRGYPNMNHLDPTGFGSYHAQEGGSDTVICTIDGRMPDDNRGTGVGSLEGGDFEVEFSVSYGEVGAQSIITYPDDTCVISGNRYPVDVPGTIDVFLCDPLNYQEFRQGYEFDCYNYMKDTDRGLVKIPSGDWYLIFSNDDSIGTMKYLEFECRER